MKTEIKKNKDIRIFVSVKSIAACFAKWAIQQSPYIVPDDLGIATIKFHARIEEAFREYLTMNNEWIGVDISQREWYKIIKSIIVNEKFVEVYQWNVRKNGNNSQFGFISAHTNKTDPDDDFIDLDALAMNVSRETWLSGAPDDYVDDSLCHITPAFPNADPDSESKQPIDGSMQPTKAE